MLGCSYIRSPYSLVVQGWIRVMLLSLTSIILTSPQVNRYIRFLSRVAGYFPYGIPYLHIVAVLDMVNHCVVTASPALKF